MKSPFPWYGGKSKIADHVWRLFTGCNNYVEPFAGSLAVLLARPGGAKGVECVNDIDHHIINFWRAMSYAPEAFARLCDFPPSSAETMARKYAMQKVDGARIVREMSYFNVEAAVAFVYNVCALPNAGWKSAPSDNPPVLESTCQRGVLRAGAVDFEALANRLRQVKIHCGDWKQSLGNGTLDHKGKCAIFLDPPYPGAIEYSKKGNDGLNVSTEVQQWAIEHGEKYAIVFCGEEGTLEKMPDSWTSYPWKRTKGGDDRHLERYWASPMCAKTPQVDHA